MSQKMKGPYMAQESVQHQYVCVKKSKVSLNRRPQQNSTENESEVSNDI